MGKHESLQAIFNYSEKEGNILKLKKSVSVIPKEFWVFARRINRFSRRTRKVRSQRETLCVLLLN